MEQKKKDKPNGCVIVSQVHPATPESKHMISKVNDMPTRSAVKTLYSCINYNLSLPKIQLMQSLCATQNVPLKE